MKQFIEVKDVKDIGALVTEALAYKADPIRDRKLGSNKKIGLLFLNPSMRTRISTQVAAMNLGMEAIVFNAGNDGWALEFEDGAVMNGNTVEHIRDAAPVLGKYFDILGIRSFPALKNREEDYSEKLIHAFIQHAGIPVVSLESATLHPLQHIKPLPQCVANSCSQWMTAWGEAEFVITHPEGYALSQQFTRGAVITTNQEEALKDADYVYVKNWSSFEDYGNMPAVEGSWMLTHEKLSLTNQAHVMHCLPVRRNVELSDEVLDGPGSLVTEQAANRVWAAQAVLAGILANMD
ncbi:MAG: acetylornithine carbamoyltransferase [Chitinophagaceae bacterium]|nr:acetylornithine carbamoyltransferase [Chitinophagaceae bacterium]